MALTLADYDQRAIDRIGTASTDTRLTQAVRYRAINDALQQICLEHDWPWLAANATITTVSGTSGYAVPTRHVRTDTIVDTSIGLSLSRRSQIEMDELIVQARPLVYNVVNATVTVKPTPDGVYTLTHRYHLSEPFLVTGTDAPLIPDVYGRGVVEYASKLLLQQVREMDRAAEAETDYRAWLKRCQDNVNQSREPLRIRVRPGAWF